MAIPKINLRDLFWLIVVVAMGVAWWQDRSAQQRRADALQNEVGVLQKELDEWNDLETRVKKFMSVGHSSNTPIP